MPISFIQNCGGTNSNATSSTLTLGVNTSRGHDLIACVRLSGAASVASMTDTATNAWSQDAGLTVGLSTSNAFIWRTHNSTSLSSSQSITVNASASVIINWFVLEFAGIASLDQANAGHAASSSISVSTGALAQANELVLSVYASASIGAPTVTPPAGWTEQNSVAALSWVDSAYIFPSSTASVTASWGAGSGLTSGAAIVSYLPSFVPASKKTNYIAVQRSMYR